MKFKTIFPLILFFVVGSVWAGPESGVVGLTGIRPYTSNPASPGTNGGNIYIIVDSGDFCGTNVFVIDTTRGAGKEAYAAALSALVAGKKIRLEVDVCNGWGTVLRSLYIIP